MPGTTFLHINGALVAVYVLVRALATIDERESWNGGALEETLTFSNRNWMFHKRFFKILTR